MVIEMPNLKNHTVSKKNHLIDECVKRVINDYADKTERIQDKENWNRVIMTFFLERTTYCPKYVKTNYLDAICYRITCAE